MSEEAVTREQEMDDLCRRLTRSAKRRGLEVEHMLYDTDESGRIEWIHIKYKGGFVGHVEVTGMSAMQAMTTVNDALEAGI